VALVNPKRGNKEPFASVGVAFKLAHAFLKSNRHLNIDLREHLDLVAVGTVADVVPLTGENRILVKAGLERLSATGKTGLRALMEVAKVTEKVSPYHIGFRIGPRLNAAGRLADAMAALELLLTEDAGRASELAKLLNDQNAERQKIEEKIVEAALEQAKEFVGDRVMVLADDSWHVGVIGIVASRVLQKYCRPVVVIGAEGKGSCRSINGFNMVGALTTCAPLLERFGGHEMAAGLSVRMDDVAALRRALNEHAGGVLSDEMLTPMIQIDAVVRLEELDAEFFEALERCEPSGTGNPTPVFAVSNVVAKGTLRRLNGGHVKFHVTDGDTTVEAIWFGAEEVVLPAGGMDVAFTATLNDFRGETTVQLRVKDVRPAVLT
jgi:single-stranded-DNA-specific exonuclease